MKSENSESVLISDKIFQFKLYDFNVYDDYNILPSSPGFDKYKDNKKFVVQMFGINSSGKTASIFVDGFNPFFYIRVNNNWKESDKNIFIGHLKRKLGSYYEDSVVSCKMVQKQKLYMFDNKTLHNFIKISFTNMAAYNRAKKLFYKDTNINGVFNRTLLKDGYEYKDDEDNITNCYLYEANIPPFLKMFHINDFSPSGWIMFNESKCIKISNKNKKTDCYYEYKIKFENIKSNKLKDDFVKYNICSFDIEASSSHGDFPLAIKDYKKLATNILENLNNNPENIENYNENILKEEINRAFGFVNNDMSLNYISKVYPKEKIYDLSSLEIRFDNFINYIPADNKDKPTSIEIDEIEDANSDSDSEAEDNVEGSSNNVYKKIKRVKNYSKKDANILDLIKDTSCDYNTKLNELNVALTKCYPKLEGDIVTFIGMSFIEYSEKHPNKRIIIVKGGCKVPEKYKSWVKENNVSIIRKSSEKGVLLEFTKIIKSENPHIITGYNITGFDFDFMFKRCQELNCVEEFLKLSRNKNEVCINKDWRTKKEDIENSKIVLASGEYNLRFPKMPGRIIIDMCVIFRKEFTLSSNKLDYVSSYFISDSVKNSEILENNSTKIYSKNLTGLSIGSYVKFEEVGYSNNQYKKGKKFEVIDIDKTEGTFIIDACEDFDLKTYKFNWGLAKDDVSPQEIFALSNGTDYDRWTVGKYCLGDCDNVIYLLLKVDVITDKIEMSNLCDVPLSFLLLRGQGIKLATYVSKKCGEKNTLMPVIEKNSGSGGYEGAHVFKPTVGLYLEDPVACVDYSSLYPSSMISENISHDTKVWTKEYDLSHNLLVSTGEQDKDGNFIYDNLESEGYSYVDITFDTYKYIRKTPKAALTKVVVGYKVCRFAQFPDGKGIVPSILEELLLARKTTRKKIKTEADEFKKNILDKRQLSIKVTANSVYGQTGAETSAFFDPDVAAATTAIGRKLLFYAREIIEQCYKNKEIVLSDGRKVITNAECVYGDTDSVFFKFNLVDAVTKKKIINKEALVYTIELAKEAGELASKFLKNPHDLEYEKTFWPWALLSKKRYVGMLYEEDPDKGKMKFMGIVLKRRDNAPIVKDIYGGVVNILMQDKSVEKSINFVYNCLDNLVGGKYSIEKLCVTKALRGYYKNPNQIAHKVLAERIGQRDAGNKPGAGDRMNYAYIKNSNKKALQGEKIETPTFINENKLELDYGHYISNQIMKPLLQLFALTLEKIPEFKERQFYLKEYNNKKNLTWEQELDKLREKWPEPEKYIKKYEELRCKEVKACLFDKYLNKLK